MGCLFIVNVIRSLLSLFSHQKGKGGDWVEVNITTFKIELGSKSQLEAGFF